MHIGLPSRPWSTMTLQNSASCWQMIIFCHRSHWMDSKLYQFDTNPIEWPHVVQSFQILIVIHISQIILYHWISNLIYVLTGFFQDVYDSFNIIMRRKPKENNFKAVLETIRDLMNTECVVPDWLHDIILGYGDPGAAHYTKSVQTHRATH